MPSDSKNKNRSRTFQAYVCVTEIDGNTVVAHGEAFDELYRSINALLERRGQSHLSFAIYLCHISFYGQGRTTRFGARAWHWPIITLYQLIYVTTNFIWCFQTRVLKTTGVTFEKKMKPWLNIFDPINLKWVSDASDEVFIHIHQGCFAGTGAIVKLPQCQWSKPDGYGKISQCITTTKHSKAKTVCIFLGIYCIYNKHVAAWDFQSRFHLE